MNTLRFLLQIYIAFDVQHILLDMIRRRFDEDSRGRPRACSARLGRFHSKKLPMVLLGTMKDMAILTLDV